MPKKTRTIYATTCTATHACAKTELSASGERGVKMPQSPAQFFNYQNKRRGIGFYDRKRLYLHTQSSVFT